MTFMSCNNVKYNILVYTLISLIGFSLLGSSLVYGVSLYSKSESPFGISHDVWIGKWWNWWIKANSGGITPQTNSCIINSTSPMVMLIETTVSGKPHQTCEISSTQGIIVPLWTGFAEASTPDRASWTYADLTKRAREAIDLGAVTSLVKVD